MGRWASYRTGQNRLEQLRPEVAVMRHGRAQDLRSLLDGNAVVREQLQKF